jgi:hypothetical protein
MIFIKAGVKLGGLRPEMAVGLGIVALVYMKYGFDLWITSGLDGVHSAKGSLHGKGLALDFRVTSYELPGPTNDGDRLIAKDCRAALGAEYDVVLEDGPKHLHVEFDPKTVTV